MKTLRPLARRPRVRRTETPSTASLTRPASSSSPASLNRLLQLLGRPRPSSPSASVSASVDADGKLAITPTYDRALDFSEGLAGFPLWAASGALLTNPPRPSHPPTIRGSPCPSATASRPSASASCGRSLTRPAAKIITPQFEEAQPFSESLACVRQEKHWGYIDKTGKFASGLGPQWDEAWLPSPTASPASSSAARPATLTPPAGHIWNPSLLLIHVRLSV